MPPVAPMLAKATKTIPTGDLTYEPKWDGFRSIIFRDGDEVEIGSRNGKPMTRYFPEVVEAVLRELPGTGRAWTARSSSSTRRASGWSSRRCSSASTRRRAGSRGWPRETPASFVAFDLLALGDEDWTPRPFAERRAALEEALAQARPPVHLTRVTDDPAVAADWFTQFEGAGLDGVVAKPNQQRYAPDKRVMFKIKHERTADCVVAGYRVHKSGPDSIGSLLLGLYDDAGELTSVGVIGAFPAARRQELFTELQPLVTTFDDHPWAWAKQEEGTRTPRASEGSRWNNGKDLSFTPLRPDLVVEVRYEHMEGERFRHMAQFNRWRPDRDPRSCTYAQLEEVVSYDLADVLGTSGG